MTVATCFRIHLAAHVIHRALGLGMRSGLESVSFWDYTPPPAKIDMCAPDHIRHSCNYSNSITTVIRISRAEPSNMNLATPLRRIAKNMNRNS